MSPILGSLAQWFWGEPPKTGIGVEYFYADGGEGIREWMLVTNPDPRFWWLPLWLCNLLGLTVMHIAEDD